MKTLILQNEDVSIKQLFDALQEISTDAEITRIGEKVIVCYQPKI